MKLSIGMMVKNESKYLRKCLESLKPIRDAIESELIIVDTGSTDNTVEIAKEFTDKVYFHKWNSDFSEMRNITLKYCTGEWFFYIDGDEIVSNPNGILQFFNSNEIKKYNTAGITIKSFTSSDNNEEFTAFTAVRIFKKDKDFHFEGAIHNQPIWKKPLIKLNFELEHYGYINNDKELMAKKFLRTSNILKNELEKNPENIYYIYQLAVSFAMHGDLEEALETIEKAYNLVKLKRLDLNKYMYVSIFLAKMYLTNSKFREVETICLEATKEEGFYIDLYYYLAKAQFAIYKNEEAIETYNTYLKKLEDFNNFKVADDLSIIDYTLGRHDYACFDMATLYERIEKYEEALKFINKIKSDKVLNNAFKFSIPLYTKLNKFEELRNFYYDITINHSLIKNYFINSLELYLLKVNKETKENIFKAFSEGDTDYDLLNKIRLISDNVYEEGLTEKINNLDFSNLSDYFGDILYYFLCEKVSLVKYLEGVNDFKIKSYFEYLMLSHENLGLNLYNYLKNYGNSQLSLDEIRIYKILAVYLFKDKTVDDEKYSEILDKYLEVGEQYLRRIYHEDIMQGGLTHCMKDEEDLFLMYMHLANKNKGNEALYIRYLRKALDSCNYMKRGIEILQNELKKKLIEKDKVMDSYKKDVKANIVKLIEDDKLDVANALINEYESLIKDDLEIYSIKSVILLGENKLLEAEKCLYNGLFIDNSNFDLLYNSAYLYSVLDEKELEIEFYKKSLENCANNDIKYEIENKITGLTMNIKNNIDSIIIKKYKKLVGKIESNTNYSNDILELLNEKKFVEVVNIFNYYLKYCKYSIGEMYYFAGVACNGLKEFEQAFKYHNIAVRLNLHLSNFVEGNSVPRDYDYEETTSNCIGCGNTDYKTQNISNQSFSESNKGIINPIRIWVKCEKCGLVYSNPIPTENSLNRYYSIIAKEKFGGIYGDIKDREQFLFQMSDIRLDNISKCTTKKSLLDIGTGIGFFIRAALDRGFDAYGLELTPEDCQYAKEHYNLDLIQRNFYSFSDEEQYDIVTMFEVIEHMRTPLKDLSRINRLVKMGGIFVIATPILDSEYGIKMKENNAFWNVVSHLSYFTKDTLIEYLRLAGFKTIAINDSLEGMGRKEFYCTKVMDISTN